MIKTIRILPAVITVVLAVFGGWRWTDHRADKAVWVNLASHQPSAAGTFEPPLIVGLPEPAQRFFRFAIKPGTPLYSVVEITMEGEFSLGSKADPNYMPMRAKQILAAPNGFVWTLNAGHGLMRVSGSDVAEDGNSWSRFWLLGIAPVARAGGNADHARSAFGRYVAEAVFWTPATMLPRESIKWDPVDENTARVTMTHLGWEQSVDLTVDETGKPTKIKFQRWSDANPEKMYRLQPFGGYLSDIKEFGGFRLPTHVEAGNHFETDHYFPFFRVNVTEIRFPQAAER
jgi:hypothetical protein